MKLIRRSIFRIDYTKKFTPAIFRLYWLRKYLDRVYRRIINCEAILVISIRRPSYSYMSLIALPIGSEVINTYCKRENRNENYGERFHVNHCLPIHNCIGNLSPLGALSRIRACSEKVARLFRNMLQYKVSLFVTLTSWLALTRSSPAMTAGSRWVNLFETWYKSHAMLICP